MLANQMKEAAGESAESDRGWYAVYTSPCHEKQVAEHFQVRGVDHFLPLYTCVRRWKCGRVVTRQCPLFPSYVFVQMRRAERAPVLSVPGVVALVGSSREAMPLPRAEIEALRNGLAQHAAAPHPFLAVGERARIRSGPLAGMQGIVLREKRSTRLVLSLDLIRQSACVEIDAADLEPLR